MYVCVRVCVCICVCERERKIYLTVPLKAEKVTA
jgi:hypothetical protein